jgi:hypothetical protein
MGNDICDKHLSMLNTIDKFLNSINSVQSNWTGMP